MRRDGFLGTTLVLCALVTGWLCFAGHAYSLREPTPIVAKETRVDKLGHINLAREMRHDDIEVENELDLVTDDDIDDKEEDVEDEDEENDTLFNLFGHDASLGARYVEPPERESYEDSEDHSRHHGSEAPSPERGDPQAPQYA